MQLHIVAWNTLLHKNLPYTLVKIYTDSEGCRATITLTPIGTQPSMDLLLTNLYAPNTQYKDFYHTLTERYLNSPSNSHVIGGDFNATVSELEDRKQTRMRNLDVSRSSNKHSMIQSSFGDFLAHKRMMDLWRYTHYSNAQHSFSRINYFMILPALSSKLKNVDIHEISITDHALVSMTIQTQVTNKDRNIWQFPTYLAGNQQ